MSTAEKKRKVNNLTEKKSPTIFEQLDKPAKKERKTKCTEGIAAVQPAAPDMGRVISRLDVLQASIERLLGIVLQEEQVDSSADNSKGT